MGEKKELTVISRKRFLEILDEEFRNYINDPNLNPVLKLQEEIQEYSSQLEKKMRELASYEEEFVEMEKEDERFKLFLQRPPMRSVGLNVNMKSPEEEAQAAEKKPEMQPIAAQVSIKQVKASASSTLLSEICVDEPIIKPGTANLSDDQGKKQLSVEQIYSKASIPNVNGMPKNSQPVGPNKRNIYTAVPVMSAVPLYGSPPVQYPEETEKKNERFKLVLQRPPMRSVGLNVSMKSPEEEVHAAKKKPGKQSIAAQVSVKQVKASGSSTLLSEICVDQPIIKPGAVDVMNLSDDQGKKQLSVEQIYSKASISNVDVKPNPQSVGPNERNIYTAVPVINAISLYGSPPVQYPAGAFATTVTSPAPVPGMTHHQQIMNVLPSDTPLSSMTEVAGPSGKPAEAVKLPGCPLPPGTAFLSPRLPGVLVAQRVDLLAASRHFQKHLAPLPEAPKHQPSSATTLDLPPKPTLTIGNVPKGVVLTWNVSLSSSHDKIKSYQLYLHVNGATKVDSAWKLIREVAATSLPMSCTLVNLSDRHCYSFAVRAVDVHSRIGPFSDVTRLVVQLASNASN